MSGYFSQKNVRHPEGPGLDQAVGCGYICPRFGFGCLSWPKQKM